MDSLDRIFKSINESSHMGKKKAKKMGKKNRYDSSSFGMKAEATLSPKQQKITAIAVNKKKIDAKDLAMLRSKRIVQILGFLKEAYEDELISEEAFLAIADPIMRSLSEVTFPDTYEKEDLDDAEKKEKKKKKPVKKPSRR